MTSQTDPLAIRRPRSDDRLLLDIEAGLYGYLAVLVAHDLRLFALLGEKPRTVMDICRALNIARRPAEALLSVSLSLGFVQSDQGV